VPSRAMAETLEELARRPKPNRRKQVVANDLQ
jgi:hypothetical protein